MTALEQLQDDLGEDLDNSGDPRVKGFAWIALLMQLLPMMIELLGGDGCGDDLFSKRLANPGLREKVTAMRMLRKALNESDETMGFFKRAAFMAALQARFSDVDNNQVLIDESIAMTHEDEWGLI